MAEAQQLFDALCDPLFKPALQTFLNEQRQEHLEMLVRAVRMEDRATLKEAFLAGKIEAYESLFRELEQFAAMELEALTTQVR